MDADQAKPAYPVKLIKIGGKALNQTEMMDSFFHYLSQLNDFQIMVHGGGNMIDHYLERLNIMPEYIQGRRVTDAATLDITVMALAGLMNKQLVARLRTHKFKPVGLSGLDGDLIHCHKRQIKTHDYGYVGDIESIDPAFLINVLQNGYTPIIASIASDQNGQLLNINADTVTKEVAKSIAEKKDWAVTLYYCFDKPGVYADANDPDTLIPKIDTANYAHYKAQGHIDGGMIVKLDNCFEALNGGVSSVILSDMPNLLAYMQGNQASVTRVVL